MRPNSVILAVSLIENEDIKNFAAYYGIEKNVNGIPLFFGKIGIAALFEMTKNKNEDVEEELRLILKEVRREEKNIKLFVPFRRYDRITGEASQFPTKQRIFERMPNYIPFNGKTEGMQLSVFLERIGFKVVLSPDLYWVEDIFPPKEEKEEYVSDPSIEDLISKALNDE